MLISDTICALATPPYRSALALLRLSGPHALEVFSHLIKKDIQKLESNHAYLLKMYENENEDSLIDEGVVTNGGRVLGVTAKGDDLFKARANAYEEVDEAISKSNNGIMVFENGYVKNKVMADFVRNNLKGRSVSAGR